LIEPAFAFGMGIKNFYQTIDLGIFVQVRLIKELCQLEIDLVSQGWNQLGQ